MQDNTRKGIIIMILTSFVFAAQDGVSRHLAEAYNTELVIMIRYWFFSLFVLWMSSRAAGGVRAVAKTAFPWLQILRAIILVFEIYVTVLAFTYLGLIETHAVFACYPLLIAALSGPVLGESVGWRRWLAIGVGFLGLLIILQPGKSVFTWAALLPLFSAILFAIYGLMNRYVAQKDSAATSFFWTGVVGVVFATLMGMMSWEPMTGTDWVWMAVLCVSGALGHFLLIKSYELAKASVLQPFAYFQLLFVTVIGISLFGESLHMHVVVGCGVIVAAGLFTLWRETLKSRTL